MGQGEEGPAEVQRPVVPQHSMFHCSSACMHDEVSLLVCTQFPKLHNSKVFSALDAMLKA